jgi:6-pyruvoyltetrahydropterin/6-carboxytetrahydropterin synthase
MIEIRRTYRFCSSHSLRRKDWDEATHERVYGRSSHPSGHGHNFRLTVVIHGEPSPISGQVVDLRVLDQRVDERVVNVYDHRNLNLDVPTLKDQVPCLENLLKDIWARLLDVVEAPARLHEIALKIDPFLMGVYRG